jgi:hypothetical protein
MALQDQEPIAALHLNCARCFGRCRLVAVWPHVRITCAEVHLFTCTKCGSEREILLPFGKVNPMGSDGAC